MVCVLLVKIVQLNRDFIMEYNYKLQRKLQMYEKYEVGIIFTSFLLVDVHTLSISIALQARTMYRPIMYEPHIAQNKKTYKIGYCIYF